jgi:hypothetical protein
VKLEAPVAAKRGRPPKQQEDDDAGA